MSLDVHIENAVARVALDTPPLNVVDLAMATLLADSIEKLRARDDLAAVVLEARGRAFCAGVDVRDHLPERGEAMIREFDRACVALWELPMPVIARVHGAALGGGAELALVCDIVCASESATFGFPEIALGVFPPVAAVLLPRMIAAQAAHELVLTGRTIDAKEALALGLANRVVPDAELDGAVAAMLAPLTARSASSLRVAKQALRLARVRSVQDAIGAAESLYLRRLLRDPDAIEGLHAFLEKRAPRWGKAAATGVESEHPGSGTPRA